MFFTFGLNGGTSASIDTTGATLLVAVVTYTGTPTVSDSKSNTWTALTCQQNTSVYSCIYYVNSGSPSVGSGHTFTISGAVTVSVINVMAFSGTGASPFDNQNGNSSLLVSTIQPGSITPSQNNDIIITGLSGGNNFGAANTIDSGFTITYQKAVTGGINYGHAGAYLIQTTAAAVNPTWNMGVSVNNVASTIASFKTTTAVPVSTAPTIGFFRYFRIR